jgi:hypothetical protein
MVKVRKGKSLHKKGRRLLVVAIEVHTHEKDESVENESYSEERGGSADLKRRWLFSFLMMASHAGEGEQNRQYSAVGHA